MSTLPAGWSLVSIGDVADVNPRRLSNVPDDVSVSFVPMSAVSEVSGKIEDSLVRPAHEVARGFTQFLEGDVLFAKITPSMENGKSAVARQLANGVGFGSTEFHVLRSNGSVVPKYLWHFIRQASFRRDAQSVMSGAVGQLRVPASYLKKYPLPVAPLAEQKRLVAKLDQLLERLSHAAALLESIPMALDRYRATLFARAFAGQLTADLRDGGPAASSGPRGWKVLPLGDISDIQSGMQVGKKRRISDRLVEVPYLRVANVQRGWLDLTEVKKISVTPSEKELLTLQTGDVLMNEGGDRDKLGRGWVWEGQISDCIHQNHVFRIRLRDSVLPPKFVSYFANERGQSYFFDQGVQTTNLASISKKRVAGLPIPVPPPDEADAIVDRIEAELAWINRVESDRRAALDLLSKLRESILKRAFSGNLVQQDPMDEPATALLSRTLTTETSAPKLGPSMKSSRRPITISTPRRIEEVLKDAGGWLSAQEAFRRCGIANNATTEQIEVIFRNLRELLAAGRLDLEPELDDAGRKLSDRLKLRSE